MFNGYEGRKESRTCDEYAESIKRTAGWIFCHLFHYYFGDSSVILENEVADGKNIRFFVTARWLEVNHAGQFGFTKDLTAEFMRHITRCHLPGCSEARRRLDAIHLFFQEGKFSESESTAPPNTCEGRRLSDTLTLARKNGFGKAIDEIMPFINWFLDDMDFWVWPDEERPGLIEAK